ncbi:MMPL family transporter [Mycolicibacterium neoaurum]|uniref:MMPL/RND family transporter n=1 Tax=Mycolicibacterium neoaurum TaxID=1795 RepID=UPI002673BABE|nr:MMPL family transporter [Mycolicibacterium neoaurum]MDO3400287.1 MMPL family transporter [Mycolicibacterium neoaurum]
MTVTPNHGNPFIARVIRRWAVPIVLGWIAFVGVLSTVAPTLEDVGKLRAVSMIPGDAPSVMAMSRVGETFDEFDSDSSVMIVLEGQQPLGEAAHRYYDTLVRQLAAEDRHVQHVQDFWSDPLTAAAVQSDDGKAAYVQVYLAGNQGEGLANESTHAVQRIVGDLTAPPGVQVYVTGPSALAADQQAAGDRSAKVIELATFGVITAMLLLVYRSAATTLVVLSMVVVQLLAARGVVAALAYHEAFGLTTFVTNLLVVLAIAAGTDYAIFLVGRYQEARSAGAERASAYYEMFRGTAHVILASGSTIAGAVLCLSFTRLPYFQTMGYPLAIGMMVAVLAALTLGPATVALVTRWGWLEPKRAVRIRGWRRIATVIVRWPGPVLVATILVTLAGLVPLLGYQTSYNERRYMPDDLPSTAGYAAAERHFGTARLNPELLLIETDQDLRNPADLMVIEKIAKKIFEVPKIGSVQTVTRPRGEPLQSSTLPAQLALSGSVQTLNQPYLDDRLADVLVLADEMQSTIDSLDKMIEIMTRLSQTTQSMVSRSHDLVDDIDELRDRMADFDDFFRPMRNYFYWEPHCYDIPACWAMRSVFDSLDGVDAMGGKFAQMLPDLDRLAELTPQLLDLLPAQIETMRMVRTMMLTMYQTQRGLLDQLAEMTESQRLMGKAFDESKNDDSFYLPPEVLRNPGFQRSMQNFISPDGKSVRFIVTHETDPLNPDGIERIDAIREAAVEAIKGTPLQGSVVQVTGTTSMFKDMQEGNDYDILIAGIAALSLIFSIMLVITRSLVAAAVIVSTVVVSLGAAFGLSILIWQHIIGLELHFMVMAMALIILLAVGADYNLLLVARFREEIDAGLNTGVIRAMGGTGSVVTAAGLVFAFTMMSMMVSELTVVAQIGTTIGIGLLFDTLVIRAFMAPAIAALLGRWFWWPQRVRPRPVPARWSTPTDKQ